MKTHTLLYLMLLSSQIVQATHLLGGFIQAKPIVGSALRYQISAVLYMDEIRGKAAADQANEILVCFGDGTTGTAYRSSRLFINDRTASVNSYTIIYAYAGPGTYSLTVSQPNRTGVKNITNADSQLFTLTTTFTTNTTTPNQTPTPGFPLNGFRIGAGLKATFSLKCTDNEGDSLVYGLAKPLTSTSQAACDSRQVTSYQFPNDLTRSGSFKLNTRTGDLVWDSPTELGYYSVAITINEYRSGNLISQTVQEITLVVGDLPGTPGIIPPYEPASQGISTGLITDIANYSDADLLLTTFPNPVEDRLQVIIQTSNPTTAIVQLTDINGRKLHELAFNRSARQHEQVMSMSGFAPGIYLLRANVGGQLVMRRIVKR